MQTEVFALWTHFWVHFIIFDKLSKKQIVRKVHENAKKTRKLMFSSLILWCSKAIQIRTVFVSDSFLQFREGDGFRALLAVEGDHHFIIVQENRIDKGIY